MSRVSNPPRVHHYIPKFYSKRWANDDGNVVRFARYGTRVVDHHVPPARVGWSNDLYRMPGEDGPEAQRLEQRFFAKVDTAADVALNKMLATPIRQLNEFDVGAWCVFTMSLFHRSPSYLAETKAFGVRKWHETIAKGGDRYAELKTATDPETYAEYVALRTDLEGEQTTMANLPDLLSSPRILRFLAAAPWLQIRIPASEYPLLLSDAPVVMTNGIDRPGGHLAMALSPRCLLVIARDRDAMLTIDRAPLRPMIKLFKRTIVRRARHFVVSDSLEQAPFIRKHFGVEPMPSLLSTPDFADGQSD